MIFNVCIAILLKGLTIVRSLLAFTAQGEAEFF